MINDEHDDHDTPEQGQRENNIAGENYSPSLSYRHQNAKGFGCDTYFMNFAHISGALREVYNDRVKRS